ncbi:MAG: hypothetical protein ABIG96_06580 [Candidatus Micrarchaeota archaeon]
MEFILLGLIEDIVFWATAMWWLWLLILAIFFYSWARDHLAFSPLLTMAVAGILIYYLVFQYPIFGSAGFLLYMLIYGGALYLIPLVLPMFRQRPKM